MSEAVTAIALTVGVLAVFGVTMALLDALARAGQWWLRPLVEVYAPAVYTAVLVVAAGLFVGLGRMDPLGALAVRDWGWLGAMLLAAPLAALAWYVVELWISSAQVRAAGLLDPGDAQASVASLVERPTLWWSLAGACAVAEEFIFRGMLLSTATGAWGPVIAIGLGAFLFGLHHVSFGVPSIISKTVGGLLTGIQTVLTGSVVPAILTHLLFQGLVYRRLRRVGRVAHAG